MDESTIIWKEAKSHKGQTRKSGSFGDDDRNQGSPMPSRFATHEPADIQANKEDEVESDDWNESEGASLADSKSDENTNPADTILNEPTQSNIQSQKTFSHQRINLKLIRNITALADPAQHNPRPYCELERDRRLSLDQWIDDAIVAISPSADMIIFSSQSPEKLVFLAKLRMEPIYQYTTKTLSIPTDFSEHVTSLLCLPIMSTKQTSLASIDWTALVIGFSSGYVKFYTEQSICLLSFKFCDEPVMSLKLQTQKINLNARSPTHFASLVDELLITYRSCAIVTDGIGLYENLRISKDDATKSGPAKFEPAYTLEGCPIILTCQKWKFIYMTGESRVLDAELLGTRCSTRFDSLKSDSINLQDHIQTKSTTRALALIGRNPFVSCYREAKDQSTHSYTEMITSLLPFWSKPQPTRFQVNEITISSNLSLHDHSRLATCIVSSPDKRLAAITDDFGRVMLMDVTNWLVIRMWKGYRNAQCGWVEVKRDPEEKGTPHASFLVIYAPKRGLLEIWSAQRGPRVAAFNVGKYCRLLYSGYNMLNMRAESIARGHSSNLVASGSLVEQSYATNCYLLNAKSETVFSIELPYTYSLYKYGDLKSRDHLLIGELTIALNQESDVSLISDILHRIVLAESLEICIHKIALDLTPKKIVPIVENLIDKTMKNYDNHASETMTNDDISILELCKRIIRLCTIFMDFSKLPHDMELSMPDVNQRLIEQYDEHPKEVDEFAARLGWTATEVLRYLSLLTLEQSYRGSNKLSAAIYGHALYSEPLSWFEFVSCFNLNRVMPKYSKSLQTPDIVCIRLRELNVEFLADDKVVKTALFLFAKLSENYYRSTFKSSPKTMSDEDLGDCYPYIEPASRLSLLFQFWLSTKLCHHWKMWAFLQDQVGRISDELKVAVMARDGDDRLLIESWKHVYQMILESDNVFAAIIATNAIKSDTLRMLSDKEKREKLTREEDEDNGDCGGSGEQSSTSAIDWECLCIDAERMSLLSQQLEDVFLLSLLLNYSYADKRIVEREFVYRVPRISVANIMRGGPSIVSELVAQWSAQTQRNENIDLRIFIEPYGSNDDVQLQQEKVVIVAAADSSSKSKVQVRPKFLPRSTAAFGNGEDHVKELLHHAKTSFPRSLDRDVILLHCLWEFCQRWTNSALQSDYKSLLLQRSIDALSLLSCSLLQQNAASLAFKTFFQRTFERLCLLIEMNSTILSPKCLRSRDTLSRRELNMGEDCLEDFVRFCCNLSEFLLQTCHRGESSSEVGNVETWKGCSEQLVTTKHQDNVGLQQQEQQQLLREQLSARLLCPDDWWSTPAVTVDNNESDCSSLADDSTFRIGTISPDYGTPAATQDSKEGRDTTMQYGNNNGATLVQATLSIGRLFSLTVLLELNRMASLMDLIFKLRIIKSYPLTLIGEESRQVLKFDLQQSPTTGVDIRLRSSSLLDLRQKFARRCIVNIVGKLTEEAPPSFASNESIEDIDSSSSAAKQLAALSGGAENVSSNSLFTRRPRQQPSAAAINLSSATFSKTRASAADDANNWDDSVRQEQQRQQANNECMLLFANLLTITNEWQLNCDELQLEFVFELFRCNHDKLAEQLIIRIQDKQTLASGLLKICSQRILVLFGLSPRGLSLSNQWRQRVDKWSLFQPNIASWLKSIQEEELHQELAELNFSSPGNELRPVAKQSDYEIDHSDVDFSAEEEDEAFADYLERALGLRLFVLKALQMRTKSVLELVTNYLDGQAGRLAYDLLQLLEMRLFDKQFLPLERKLWLSQQKQGEKSPSASRMARKSNQGQVR